MIEGIGGYKSFFRQLSIVSIICLGCFISGSMHGWTAPALSKLVSGVEIITITPDEGSWLALSSEIGHFIAPIPAGILADIFGRKPMFLLSSTLAVAGWGILLFANTITIFISGRIVLGFNYGIQCLVMNIYVAEIASKQIRGAFGSMLYLTSNAGVLFQFILGAFFSLRMTSLITLILCGVYFFLCWFVIESPYFLVAAKNEEKAKNNLSWLRAAPPDKIVDEFNIIRERVKVKEGVVRSFKRLTSKPDCKGFILCIALSFLSDLTGRIPVLSYATENFKTLTSCDANTFTILLGFCNVLFPFISLLLSDMVGRKILLIVSASLGALMHFATALLYFLTLETRLEIPGSRWFVFVTITVNLCCCSIYTTNVLTLRGDLLAENGRGFASGFSSTAFGLAASLDIKLFQFVGTRYGIYSAFWTLCALGIVFTVFTGIFIPETKNKTFKEIQNGLSAENKKNVDN